MLQIITEESYGYSLFFKYLLLANEWSRELPQSSLKLATEKQNSKIHVLGEFSRPHEPDARPGCKLYHGVR